MHGRSTAAVIKYTADLPPIKYTAIKYTADLPPTWVEVAADLRYR